VHCRFHLDDLDVVFAAIHIPPWSFAAGKHIVDSLDVLHTTILEPVSERYLTFIRKDWNPFLPCRPTAQYSRKRDISSSNQLQNKTEYLVGGTAT